jgi:hypothetical protein
LKRGEAVSNEKRNIKDSITKAMKSPVRDIKNDFHSDTSRRSSEEIDNNKEEFHESSNIEQVQPDVDEKAKRKKLDRQLKIFGGICIAAAIVALINSGSSTVDTSESSKNALENKVSTAISAGTILLSADENVGAKDYTVTHKSDAKDTKIRVWDYAAEDGDFIQVIVNGAAAGDAFMIKHKPKEITIPAAGKVQIKGIKDGGGGITYAVRYDINGTSYFNGAPEGELNTYTIIKE